MKTISSRLALLGLGVATLILFTGCGSTNGGSTEGSVYYGSGLHDPWYYGEHWDDADIIVTPPSRPDEPIAPPRPSHPIATPPSMGPRPMPMPTIPMVPRASFRR